MPTITFRPQITMSKPVVRQAEADFCRENLNRVEKAVHNNNVSDIGAMTEKIRLETNLNDTKVPPVKYVEEIKPQNIQTQKVDNSDLISSPHGITDVIKSFHKKNTPSKHEQSQVLFNQMNMLAANNMVLHGLV